MNAATADDFLARAQQLVSTGRSEALSTVYLNGLVFVPLLAVFMKAFGTYPGLLWAGVSLVLLSASLSVIVAGTVWVATHRLFPSLLAGALVAADAIVTRYGINGYSDSVNFLFIGLAFLAFFRCAQKPTLPRLVVLGVSLFLLGIGHGTWAWPAVLWALLAAPLIRARRVWFPIIVAEEIESGSRWSKLRNAVPVAVLMVGYTGLGLFLQRYAGASGFLGLTGVSSSFLAHFAVRYDPHVADASQFSMVTFPRALSYYAPEAATAFGRLIDGHVISAMHVFPIVALALASGLVVIGRSRLRTDGMSIWGWALLLLVGVLMIWTDRGPFSIAPTFLLLIGLLAAWVPVARVMWLLIGLLTIITVMFWMFSEQLRHTNMIIYTLYVLIGVVVGQGLEMVKGSRFPSRLRRFRTPFRTLERLPLASGLLLLSMFVIRAAVILRVSSDRLEEDRYLNWLASVMPADAVLLTSGNVDPWRVNDIIQRSVVYDVENGGRLFISGTGEPWEPLNHLYPDIQATGRGTQVFLERLASNGIEARYYEPGIDPRKDRLKIYLFGGERPPRWVLARGEAFPPDNKRFAYSIGRPIAQ